MHPSPYRGTRIPPALAKKTPPYRAASSKMPPPFTGGSNMPPPFTGGSNMPPPFTGGSTMPPPFNDDRSKMPPPFTDDSSKMPPPFPPPFRGGQTPSFMAGNSKMPPLFTCSKIYHPFMGSNLSFPFMASKIPPPFTGSKIPPPFTSSKSPVPFMGSKTPPELMECNVEPPFMDTDTPSRAENSKSPFGERSTMLCEKLTAEEDLKMLFQEFEFRLGRALLLFEAGHDFEEHLTITAQISKNNKFRISYIDPSLPTSTSTDNRCIEGPPNAESEAASSNEDDSLNAEGEEGEEETGDYYTKKQLEEYILKLEDTLRKFEAANKEEFARNAREMASEDNRTPRTGTYRRNDEIPPEGSSNDDEVNKMDPTRYDMRYRV